MIYVSKRAQESERKAENWFVEKKVKCLRLFFCTLSFYSGKIMFFSLCIIYLSFMKNKSVLLNRDKNKFRENEFNAKIKKGHWRTSLFSQTKWFLSVSFVSLLFSNSTAEIHVNKIFILTLKKMNKLNKTSKFLNEGWMICWFAVWHGFFTCDYLIQSVRIEWEASFNDQKFNEIKRIWWVKTAFKIN